MPNQYPRLFSRRYYRASGRLLFSDPSPQLPGCRDVRTLVGAVKNTRFDEEKALNYTAVATSTARLIIRHDGCFRRLRGCCMPPVAASTAAAAAYATAAAAAAAAAAAGVKQYLSRVTSSAIVFERLSWRIGECEGAGRRCGSERHQMSARRFFIHPSLPPFICPSVRSSVRPSVRLFVHLRSIVPHQNVCLRGTRKTGCVLEASALHCCTPPIRCAGTRARLLMSSCTSQTLCQVQSPT